MVTGAGVGGSGRGDWGNERVGKWKGVSLGEYACSFPLHENVLKLPSTMYNKK